MNYLNIAAISKVNKNFSVWDIVAVSLIFWIFILIANGTEYMYAPVPINLNKPISLDISNIPEYALRSTFRLFIGLGISIIFSIIYALLAAKIKRLERILISLLDILQSVPVLGYISFTVTGFIALFPGNILGFELAVIFAVFTCQVWNITYSIYQSIITLPKNLDDASKLFNLNPIQKFIFVEFPYAIPSLVWNMMLSMSSAWFFIVASEAIIEGNHQYFLPGIGSYIAAAIYNESISSILYAIIAMIVVIILYDQLFFRPLIDWSEKFKYEEQYINNNKSWGYKLYIKSQIFNILLIPFNRLLKLFTLLYRKKNHSQLIKENRFDWLYAICWYLVIIFIGIYGIYAIYSYFDKNIHFSEVKETLYLGLITTIRII